MGGERGVAYQMPRARLPVHMTGALASLAISVGVLFGGMNDRAGEAMLSALGCGIAGLAILRTPPSVDFWRTAAPIAGCTALAAIWALVPLCLPDGVMSDGPLAPDLAALGAISLVGYLAWFLAGAALAQQAGPSRWAIDSLLILGTIVFAAGLAIREIGSTDAWDIWRVRSDGRFTGTFNNANVAGAYCGMLAALAFGQVIASGAGQRATTATQLRRILCGTAAAFALGACALTGSRSAIACTLAALLLIAIPRMRRPNTRRRALVAVAVVVAIVAIAVVAGISDTVIDRLATDRASSAERASMWRHYAALAAQAPWFGYGLGVFPDLNMAMLAGPRMAGELWMVNSPHNLILQLLLQGGIGYLLAIMAAAGCVAWGMLRRGGARPWDPNRPGIVAAIIVAVGCAMVDIALDVPAMIALTVFLAGLAWGRQRARTTSMSRERTSRQPSISGR